MKVIRLESSVSRRRFLRTAAGVSLAGMVPPALSAGNQSSSGKPQTPSDQKLSPAFIGGGGRVERNFYGEWLKNSGVPRIDGYSIYDAATQEVKDWPDIGGRGLYLNFSGNVHMDAVIMEIPPGKALNPAHHMYEQLIFVLSGRGYTRIEQDKKFNNVRWAEGSLFAPPLNATHRHYNEDPSKPARLLAVTTFPLTLQLMGNVDFVSKTQFNFSDRYDGQEEYFKTNERIRQRWEKRNFVPDIRTAEVVKWEERGGDNSSMFWDMGGNTILEPHISEFGVGEYKRGHRHPYEAIIVILNGEGFSIAGKNDLLKDYVKMDWKQYSVVSPPYFWWHQHFNTGTVPARYYAVTEGDFPKRLGIPLEVEQIEADREDPGIRRLFDEELRKKKTTVGR
jgi:quercetin dioxygenase-like cupin family protein